MDQQKTHPIDRIAQVKQMYRKVLAGWAQDVLLLRARGLDRPTWQPPARYELAPAPAPSNGRARTGRAA